MNNNSDILDVWPLTPLQEGLFALNKLNSGYDPYHIQLLFKIDGKVDYELFFNSINNTIDRYPNLRAAFYDEDLESPIQIIANSIYPNKNKIKLDKFIGKEKIYEEIIKITKQEFIKPFNLSYGCPMRVLFIEAGENLSYFILTCHHIIIDGWSLPLFFNEIMKSYEFLNRKDLIQDVANYKDYIIWLKNKDTQEGLNIWKNYLSGIYNPTLLFNKVSNTSSLIRYNGKLSRIDTQDLVFLSKKLSLTLNSLFLFSWSIILGYLTNSSDVVFGVTVSGRPYDLENVNNMIGLFINTIACRVKLDPMLSLGEQCCKFQEELFKIRDYEYIGLSSIQRNLGINNNLFDTLLIFQNTPTYSSDIFEIGSAKISPISLIDSTHYPLTLVAALVDGEFLVEVELKSDLIDVIDGENIVNQILSILNNFSRNENKPLGHFAFLGEKDSDLLPIINDNKYPNGVWGIFKDIFKKNSKDICLIIPDISNNDSRCFSIGDLFYLSEKISVLISSKLDINISRVIRVGILLSRDEFLISSFFACIKLGLVIVPLDISFPDDKIFDISKRGDLKLLITNTDIVIDGLEIINLKEYNFDDIEYIKVNNRFVSLDQQIYTIFTSGTTGQPKGVTATHSNIISLMDSHNSLNLDKFGLDNKLRVGHAWSFAFDASWQPLIYFLSGNILVLLDEDIQKDPDLFIKSVHRYNIDFIEVSPTLLKNIDLDKLFDKSYHQLKVLGLGGEAIDNNLWFKLRNIPKLKVINFYGPTETCVDALFGNFDDSKVPILGVPFNNFRAIILDNWLRQCGFGIIGELYLVSNQVTVGYLNDFKLTSVKFIAFDNGYRMYRTGDLVSLNKEGFFVYHGRVDDQIKVNGFRVDPKELEKILISNIQIDNARVFVLDTKNGKKLSAVIILRYKGVNQQEVLGTIYNYLRQSVASYLIPSSISIVDKFPLTSNGKLDVKSLPEAVIISSNKAKTKTQVYLSKIIKDLLSLDDNIFLDIKIDFRSLGLDSILIIQFSNFLRQEGFDNVNPRIILRNNNIFELANFLDISLSRKNIDNSLVINDYDFNNFKLTPIMKWLLRCKNWRRFCQWSVISIPKNYTYNNLLENIKQLINIHDILRLRIDKTNEYEGKIETFDKVVSQDFLKVFKKDLYEYSKEDLSNLVKDIIDEIDPERGIIFRILWFSKQYGGHIIFIVHHLACDGVSWRIILDDLKNFDSGNIVNEVTTFPKWAFILDNKRVDIESSNCFIKWKDYLNIEQLPLGTRYIDSNIDLACNSYSISIITSWEVTKLFLKLSKQGFTLEEILLTIFVDTINRWYKLKYLDKEVRYILIDKESHGRDDSVLNYYGEERDDLSRTLGWFTVISPLKLEVNNNGNILDKLNSTKRSILDIVGKDIDFSLLYNKINFSGSQIEFNFHGILDSFNNDSKWEMVIDNEILDVLPSVSEPLLNRVYSFEVNSIILSNYNEKKLVSRFDMSKDVFSYDDFILMQNIWKDTLNKYYEELLLLMGEK